VEDLPSVANKNSTRLDGRALMRDEARHHMTEIVLADIKRRQPERRCRALGINQGEIK